MDNEAPARIALPTYRSHKVIEAAKILDVQAVGPGNCRLTLDHFVDGSPDGAPTVVELLAPYLSRHKPLAGGYYVRYADGYESWSPVQAFEEGYLPVIDIPDAAAEQISFHQQLERLINANSRENASNTPDFILAQFMLSSLEAFEAACNARAKFYNGEPETV